LAQSSLICVADGVRNCIEVDSSLEKQGSHLLTLINCQSIRRGLGAASLPDGVILVAVCLPVREGEDFLAEDDTLLKQEYSILAVDVGSLHHKTLSSRISPKSGRLWPFQSSTPSSTISTVAAFYAQRYAPLHFSTIRSLAASPSTSSP